MAFSAVFVQFQHVCGQQAFQHDIQRQAHHRGPRAAYALHHEGAAFLDAVGSSLVQRVAAVGIGFDERERPRGEGHVGHVVEAFHMAVHGQTAGGDDLMRAAGKAREHGHGFGFVAGFAEDVGTLFVADDDRGVGREHGRAVIAMGKGGEHVPGLGFGTAVRVFARVFAGDGAWFGAVGGQNFEGNAHAFKKSAAARRAGREDKRT